MSAPRTLTGTQPAETPTDLVATDEGRDRMPHDLASAPADVLGEMITGVLPAARAVVAARGFGMLTVTNWDRGHKLLAEWRNDAPLHRSYARIVYRHWFQPFVEIPNPNSLRAYATGSRLTVAVERASAHTLCLPVALQPCLEMLATTPHRWHLMAVWRPGDLRPERYGVESEALHGACRPAQFVEYVQRRMFESASHVVLLPRGR